MTDPQRLRDLLSEIRGDKSAAEKQGLAAQATVQQAAMILQQCAGAETILQKLISETEEKSP